MSLVDLLKKPTSLLYKALEIGNFSLIEKSLSKGAQANSIDHYGLTPLIIASLNGYPPEIFKLLIEHGANVNTQNPQTGLSPLMISAAVSPYREVIETLCENYANIEDRDSQGNTPLMWAISLASFSLRQRFTNHCPVSEIVQELIEWDADVNATNKNGDSAWDKIYTLRRDTSPEKDAVEVNKTYDILCKNGASPSLTIESFIRQQIHNPKIDEGFSKALITMTLVARAKSQQIDA